MSKLAAFILGLGLVAAAFAGLALAMVLGVVTAAGLLVARITGRLQPAMARTGAAKPQSREGVSRDFKVWNDGRGTIIDM